VRNPTAVALLVLFTVIVAAAALQLWLALG